MESLNQGIMTYSRANSATESRIEHLNNEHKNKILTKNAENSDDIKFIQETIIRLGVCIYIYEYMCMNM